MVLTHVDLIEKLLHYNRASYIFFVFGDIWEAESFSVAMERTKDKTNL